MTNSEILKYVANTIGNTNPSILNQMINQIRADSATNWVDVVLLAWPNGGGESKCILGDYNKIRQKFDNGETIIAALVSNLGPDVGTDVTFNYHISLNEDFYPTAHPEAIKFNNDSHGAAWFLNPDNTADYFRYD